ncbi:MAG TPA: S9 family peptidase [Candidatus Binatia bacterium]|nr:S9 family peptidase [Candidatus Binatia bacterium]
MNRQDLTRRELLLTAATTAGMLLGHGAIRGAQAADRAPLISRRLLFAGADRSTVRISPDGRRIAFMAPVDGVLNLWVGALDNLAKARPLTRVTDRDLGPWIVWLYNNRHVAFFRDQGGDENWQAHRVDVDTGDIFALTPGPGVKSYIQQTSRHFPDELLIAHNQRDQRFSDIFRVNVATGASTLLLANDRFAWVFTDPRFRARFGVRQTDAGDTEYLQRGAGGDWELFTRIDMADAMTTRAIEFSDDGTELYWLDSRGRDKAVLVGEDLRTGARRILAEDPEADLVEVMLEPRSYRPFAAAAVFARKRWQMLDPAYGKDRAYLAKVSPGDLTITSVSADNRRWLLYYEQDVAPGRYFAYDRGAGKARFLFSARRALEKAPLVPMQPVTVRARDGLELVCYLSRPRNSGAGQPLPMVLLVHGGPWARDIWALSSTHQWLANRGYAVLSVNFRGSTGLGKRFLNAANLEWGGKMHDDLIDAVDWAIARGVADPKRVAIYGASYGGYSALVGATFTPEKFACAIDLFGISNLVTFMNAIPPYWKPWQALWKARMGDYTTEAGRRFLQERSPLNRADRIVRPLLIGQGVNDVRVKPSESDQIVAAMRERGVPVTYVFYSDEGHGFGRVENRRSFTAVVEAFLAKHLGGRLEPVGNDFAGSTIDIKAGRELIPGLG